MPPLNFGYTATPANANLDVLPQLPSLLAGLAPQGGRVSTSLAQYLANNAIYNVLDFGAKGDGATDDLAKFQAAVAAMPSGSGTLGVAPYQKAGTLYLPNTGKPYVLGGLLTIDRGMRICAEPGAMLYLKDGASTSVLRIAHGANQWVEIFNLQIEGNRFTQAGSSCHGIVFDTGGTALARYRDLLHNVLVRNCRGNGLEWVSGAPLRIYSSIFHDNSFDQIHDGPASIDHEYHDTWAVTDAIEAGTIGWHCEGSNCIWNGGALSGVETGAKLSGLRNVITSGTSVDTINHHGVWIQGSDTIISACQFRDIGKSVAGTYDLVHIDGSLGGSLGLRNLVTGCYLDGATPGIEGVPGTAQAAYAVNEVSGAGLNVITGNKIVRTVNAQKVNLIDNNGSTFIDEARVGLTPAVYDPPRFRAELFADASSSHVRLGNAVPSGNAWPLTYHVNIGGVAVDTLFYDPANNKLTVTKQDGSMASAVTVNAVNSRAETTGTIAVTPLTDKRTQVFTAPLTGNLIVALSRTGAYEGLEFILIRQNATGAFTFTVEDAGPVVLKVGSASTAVAIKVTYTGAAWVLTGYELL